jgi:hypothetical protein
MYLQAVAGEESSMVLVPAWGQHEPPNCPVLGELVEALNQVSESAAGGRVEGRQRFTCGLHREVGRQSGGAGGEGYPGE